MSSLQIKAGGVFLELPQDISISLEQSSPLFNEQGTFSFPFEIPVEPNRQIFKGVDDPFHDISLSDIDGMEAELWFGQVMLYRGIIQTDEEVEFEDSVPVTFLSGNSDFSSKTESMNAKDVPLDREIEIGRVVTNATFADNVGEVYSVPLPDHVMMDYTGCNVSDPYPVKPYCNVRVCTSNENGYYKVLDARRPFSGVCFYVMYFLDCLMKKLNIVVGRNDLLSMEDMARLAFFTTQCHTEPSGVTTTFSLEDIRRKDFCGDIFSLTVKYDNKLTGESVEQTSESFHYYGEYLNATNENFPDVSVDDILSDLRTAFGVRFMYDSLTNTMQIIYIKDVLRDNVINTLNAEILEVALSRSKQGNIRMTYEQGGDDTMYNYTDYSRVHIYNGYASILSAGVNRYDRTCKIDSVTGNAYRVKVDKDTGEGASLFEVGGFRDFVQPGVSSAEEQEESISFLPVNVNSIAVQRDDDGSYSVPGSTLDGHRRSRSSDREENTNERVLAIFADVELKSDTVFDKDIWGPGMTQSDDSAQKRGHAMVAHLKALCQEMYDDESSDEPPLRNYDAGYVMGIMRGPGNDSGVETVETDYDGEGNNSWVQTVGSYSFTADSCDMYGRFFDYNGTEQGGADQDGRFSLKLVAEKDGYPIGDSYKDRGLVAKFLSEYLYFMANKKTVMLTVKMSITQIVGIDFLKRYRIGDYVGFINRISYTLTATGIDDIQVEMYIL